MRASFGFELLVEQGALAAASRIASIAAVFESEPRCGDSPIERLFYAAIYTHVCFASQINFKEVEPVKALPSSPDTTTLYIQRQFEVPNVGRVDFLITHWASWNIDPDSGKEGFRSLIVECDGHDFHERTKDQAIRDRSRDRTATLIGLEVFRFTGSELWRDPFGCAAQVVAWADRGV